MKGITYMSKNSDLLDPKEIGTAKRPATKSSTSNRPVMPLSGVYGVLLFFVSISILYANYMVYFGTDFSWINVALLSPSTLFVGVLVLYKFAK